MALRSRIPTRGETLQDVARACEDRYWEGMELLAAARNPGGIYLLGYVAEMLFKLACFRIDGARPADLVPPLLGPTRAWAKRHIPSIDPESFHSLLFWGEVYLIKRATLPYYDPMLGTEIRMRTARLHGNWVVEMRYVDDRSLPSDVIEVYDDVEWLWKTNQKGLL